MAIDLLNLEPTKISRDLKGKYILAYGLPKIGKTSLVASFPKSLIFSFEPGTNGLNNIYKINITSWKDFKLAVKQLANDKVKEKFDFVSVDTVDILTIFVSNIFVVLMEFNLLVTFLMAAVGQNSRKSFLKFSATLR